MREQYTIVVGFLLLALYLLPISVAEVDYNFEIKDRTDDVIDNDFGIIVSDNEDIDITKASSQKTGSNLILEMEVKGEIVKGDNFSYEFKLKTKTGPDENSSSADFIIQYNNGSAAIMGNNGTITQLGNVTIDGGKITITVPMEELGNVTTFEMWCSAMNDDSGKIYIDFAANYKDYHSGSDDSKKFIPGFAAIGSIFALSIAVIFNYRPYRR